MILLVTCAEDTMETDVISMNNVLYLVNKYRAEVGAPAVEWSFELEKQAQEQCIFMYETKKFEHGHPNENIAWGQRTVMDVIDDWMGSPGHRDNILNPRFTIIGMAKKDIYWAMILQ